MLIYNVTINIENDIHDKWIKWMNQEHIPEVLSTGKFLEAKMAKVLVEEEMGGTTFSVQFLAKDKVSLEKYYREDAAILRKKTAALFGNSLVSFRTELEIISEHKRQPIKATEYLFSYGSLQDTSIHYALLGRSLEGEADALMGYVIAQEKIAGEFVVAEPSIDPKDKIEGHLYVLSHMDIAKIDSYEGPAYKRIKLLLDSGKNAWTYVRNVEDKDGA